MINNLWKPRIIIVILLLPLFFINIKNSHDWGDDFAQYLIQARNIVEGKPQADNGLLLNVKDPVYAVEAYPVGFPVLLAPVYCFFKLEILPYNIFNSLLLFFTGLLCFEFFRKRTNALTAILITLLFCFNLTTIDLKKQILSEIPFTLSLFSMLLWTESSYYRKKYSWIISGLLLCVLVSIRLAGISGVVAFLLFESGKLFRTKVNGERKRNVFRLSLTFLSFAVSFLLINQVLFKVNILNLFGFYTNALASHENYLLKNFDFYFHVSEYVFPFFGTTITSFWILIALTGWIMRFIKSASFSEYFFPVYIVLILFYPYSNAGLRFLIPILPLLIYYCVYFFDTLYKMAGNKFQLLSPIILLIVFSAYLKPIMGIVSRQSEIEDGPQRSEAVELFEYLKKLPQESIIAFCRVRAMSLYSEHRSLYIGKDQSQVDIHEQFQRYKSLYLVISKAKPGNQIYDPVLLNYISTYKNECERVWENEGFLVYIDLTE